MLLAALLYSAHASRLSTVAWWLVLSGGAGNFEDRLLHHGRVIDFMNLGIGSLRTGIFNVADVCITIGVIVLAVEFIRQRN